MGSLSKKYLNSRIFYEFSNRLECNHLRVLVEETNLVVASRDAEAHTN